MKFISRIILMGIAVMVPSVVMAGGYDLNVGEFTELRVSSGINVDYVCTADSAGHAWFECPASMASSIMFTNKNGRLTVQLSPDCTVKEGLPTIHVASRYLTKAQNYSDSTLRVLSVKDTPKFEALLEGNGRLVVRDVEASKVQCTARMGHGTLVVSGRCNEAKLKLLGACVIEADGLQSEEVSVNCNGTGSIGLYARKTLSVFGSGSTTVYYLGTPSIKNRTIGIKLLPLGKTAE